MQYLPHEIPDDVLLNSQFHNGRGFDYAAAAAFFGVSPRTIRRWHKAKRAPLSARQLMLIHDRGYLPIHGHWRGFSIRNNVLYTPYEKFTFTPQKLLATWHLINAPEMAKQPQYKLFLRAASGSLFRV